MVREVTHMHTDGVQGWQLSVNLSDKVRGQLTVWCLWQLLLCHTVCCSVIN